MYSAQKATLIRKLYRHYQLPTYGSVIHHLTSSNQYETLAYVRKKILRCIYHLPNPADHRIPPNELQLLKVVLAEKAWSWLQSGRAEQWIAVPANAAETERMMGDMRDGRVLEVGEDPGTGEEIVVSRPVDRAKMTFVRQEAGDEEDGADGGDEADEVAAEDIWIAAANRLQHQQPPGGSGTVSSQQGVAPKDQLVGFNNQQQQHGEPSSSSPPGTLIPRSRPAENPGRDRVASLVQQFEPRQDTFGVLTPSRGSSSQHTQQADNNDNDDDDGDEDEEGKAQDKDAGQKDKCAVCFHPFPDADSLRCRACRRRVHRTCFERFKRTREESGQDVRCIEW